MATLKSRTVLELLQLSPKDKLEVAEWLIREETRERKEACSQVHPGCELKRNVVAFPIGSSRR